MITTTRLGMDVPDNNDQVSAGPTDFQQAFGILDNAAIILSGTLVARPTASIFGRFYLATNDPTGGPQGTISMDTGSTWIIPNQGTFRSGTSSAQPAAGTFGRVYYQTDGLIFQLDTGSAWQTMSQAASGSAGGRPSAGAFGRWYYDTTNKVFEFDNGSAWLTAAQVTTGTVGSLPTAGVQGRHYWATDQGTWFLDNGTNWLALGLSPALSAVSTNVEPGVLMGMTAGLKVASLDPTNAMAGDFFGVRVGTGINAASPVVVNTVSGVITLPGSASSVTSFILGTPGSFAVLVWDGGTFRCISGGEDSGWVALTLPGSVFAIDGITPATRRVNGVVTFRGGTTVVTTPTTIATVEVNSRPSTTLVLPMYSVSPSSPGQVTLNTSGQVQVQTAGSASSISMYGVSYPLFT